MKKVLALGLAALSIVLLTQQQASAWKKCNFGVGLNFCTEGANNSVLWGVLQGGPAPGMADGGYGSGNPNFTGGHPTGPEQAPAFAPSYAPPMDPYTPPPGPTGPARPMLPGTPGVAQPVGYFPGYSYYPACNYPMYYYYPMVPR